MGSRQDAGIGVLRLPDLGVGEPAYEKEHRGLWHGAVSEAVSKGDYGGTFIWEHAADVPSDLLSGLMKPDKRPVGVSEQKEVALLVRQDSVLDRLNDLLGLGLHVLAEVDVATQGFGFLGIGWDAFKQGASPVGVLGGEVVKHALGHEAKFDGHRRGENLHQLGLGHLWRHACELLSGLLKVDSSLLEPVEHDVVVQLVRVVHQASEVHALKSKNLTQKQGHQFLADVLILIGIVRR